jgi:hypothetical protein
MINPEAAHGGARQKGSSSEAKLEGPSKARVSQARAVLAYSPTLAGEVCDGFPLNKAFEMIAT